MGNLFLAVLNMSLTASYVIVFVIIIRLWLKKIPKIYSYVLWLAVLFRLTCPFSFESIFSFIPENVNIPQDIAYSPKPEINSGIAAIDSAVNNVLPPPVNPAASANPMQIWLAIGEAVWLIGIAMLLIYSVYTSVKLYRNLRNAKHIENNIYTANGFKTPFVFGIVNPRIYLPDHLSESEKSYVLLHEQTHIKRLDHIVKAVFFIVTCIHWFNPLVWIAFYLMSEDMELSCDEKVVKQKGSNIKKEYSTSLLSMSTGRKIIGGSPIAFGENNTKGRIKNILNYKKPGLWVLIAVSIIIVIFIIGLISNPKSDEATTWDRKPMIMVNGELFLDTGKEVPVEIDESAIIGEISSSVDQSEKPTEEGQTNFGNIGAKYAHFEDNIVVLINNEWVLFEKEVSTKSEETYVLPINREAVENVVRDKNSNWTITDEQNKEYQTSFVIKDRKDEPGRIDAGITVTIDSIGNEEERYLAVQVMYPNDYSVKQIQEEQVQNLPLLCDIASEIYGNVDSKVLYDEFIKHLNGNENYEIKGVQWNHEVNGSHVFVKMTPLNNGIMYRKCAVFIMNEVSYEKFMDGQTLNQ